MYHSPHLLNNFKTAISSSSPDLRVRKRDVLGWGHQRGARKINKCTYAKACTKILKYTWTGESKFQRWPVSYARWPHVASSTTLCPDYKFEYLKALAFCPDTWSAPPFLTYFVRIRTWLFLKISQILSRLVSGCPIYNQVRSLGCRHCDPLITNFCPIFAIDGDTLKPR